MSPIVIYRLGSLGDTCVALPCFHKIEQAFPGREKVVLTNVPISTKAAALEVILGPAGLIDRAIDYPVNLKSFKALWDLRRQLKSIGSKTLIYLAADRGLWRVMRDVCFFKLCGFTKIIGAPTNAGLLNNRIDPLTGIWEPEAERLTRTLFELGPIDLLNPTFWDLRLTASELAIAASALSPLGSQSFFAINMGGKAASKDWGEQNWAALISCLAQQLPPLALAAVGAADDADRAEQILALWPGQRLNLCGPLSPRQCAAVLKQARFFVGHDSGPLHLAAATGTPCIGLFGNYNQPRKWHPYGNQHLTIHELRGVNAITVDQVLDSVMDVARKRLPIANLERDY